MVVLRCLPSEEAVGLGNLKKKLEVSGPRAHGSRLKYVEILSFC